MIQDTPNNSWECTFCDKLEETLDEYFPKIEEEGKEKQANNRRAALVLYATAVILAKEAVFKEWAKITEKINNIIVSTDWEHESSKGVDALSLLTSKE